VCVTREREPRGRRLIEHCELVIGERHEAERIVEDNVACQRHDLRLAAGDDEPYRSLAEERSSVLRCGQAASGVVAVRSCQR
jgi:hypothetical protein